MNTRFPDRIVKRWYGRRVRRTRDGEVFVVGAHDRFGSYWMMQISTASKGSVPATQIVEECELLPEKSK